MRCSANTSFGVRCNRRSPNVLCYQHKNKETDLEDLSDFQLLDIVAYAYDDLTADDFRDIFSKLTDDKKTYFLRALDLDPSTDIEALLEMIEDIEDFPNIDAEYIKSIPTDDQRRFLLKLHNLNPEMTVDEIINTFFIKTIPMQEEPSEEDTDEEIDDNHQSISIDSDDTSMLINPDEIVLPRREEISIVYNYPLSEDFIKTFYSQSEEGFTRKELLEFIREGYEEIYADPDKYGIWGHGIQDLVLQGVKQENDRIILSIGS